MRDPRIDPRDGDVVRATIGAQTTRTVLESPWTRSLGYRDMVYYSGQTERSCWITSWREWCRKRKAEVVKIANKVPCEE